MAGKSKTNENSPLAFDWREVMAKLRGLLSTVISVVVVGAILWTLDNLNLETLTISIAIMALWGVKTAELKDTKP